MKGFEVGKRVRAKCDITCFGKIVVKKGSVVIIEEISGCCKPSIFWGYFADGRAQCHVCGNHYSEGKKFEVCENFEPIDDDEIEIQADTFKQVTFTKIIENVPSGVN